jgi:hypothetical protein
LPFASQTLQRKKGVILETDAFCVGAVLPKNSHIQPHTPLPLQVKNGRETKE